MGGGEGSYEGFVVNEKGPWGSWNPNGTFKVIKATKDEIALEGESAVIKGAKIRCAFDANGQEVSKPEITGY
jgi:hypothetical protein